MSFPNDVKSIIFFGKSNLELYFSAIPYSFTPDSLQIPYSLSPDWVLIGHYIFKSIASGGDAEKICFPITTCCFRRAPRKTSGMKKGQVIRAWTRLSSWRKWRTVEGFWMSGAISIKITWRRTPRPTMGIISRLCFRYPSCVLTSPENTGPDHEQLDEK